MSYLDRFQNIASADLSRYLPFLVEGETLGHITTDFARHLKGHHDVFRVTPGSVELNPDLATVEARTKAVEAVLRQLLEEGHIRGWRGETYPVGLAFSAPTAFYMERAAVAHFGVRAYGVHMNGFVREGGKIKMWIGKRADDKPVAPGKLDQIVAGGQPSGLSLRENLIKECGEEADIPPELARQAKSVGTISYCTERPEGLRNDTLYNYDLELSVDFTPRNTDGELQDFYLWPIEEVLERIRETNNFKFNCALVIIDFAIRHGLINADEPDYAEIVQALHC